MPNPARELFSRFVKAMNELDFEQLEKILHPDFEGEYPQSGERFRGFAAFRSQLEQYPGGLPTGSADPDSALLIGDEDRWVITPGYTVLPLAGPDRYTTVVKTKYPDGSLWYIVGIIELRDGLIYRTTSYFAPEFEPPEWRKDLTERS
jgi:hypothetical protein